MSKLIILRGNSGSGKTTTAKAIQNYFPRGKVMLISQDEIRLGILNVKDRKENPTADLIRLIAEFGYDKFDVVIVEGILGSHIYKEMFEHLCRFLMRYTLTTMIFHLKKLWHVMDNEKKQKNLVLNV